MHRPQGQAGRRLAVQVGAQGEEELLLPAGQDGAVAAGPSGGFVTESRRLVGDGGVAAVDRLGLDPEDYEFQMLLGVDPELRNIILSEGHRLRVYVPFGRDWYPYSMRRLRENPSVAGHVMRENSG